VGSSVAAGTEAGGDGCDLFFCESVEQRERVRGEKGAGYKILTFVGPSGAFVISPTFISFRTEEYSPFVFLGIEEYKQTAECVLFSYSVSIHSCEHQIKDF
jgi:hypothetical protein